MTDKAWQRRSLAARKYQPKRIRLLLIAESPPKDEERHFYSEQGGDPLFDEVCGVLFEEKPQDDKVRFLKELRRRGVFAIDLKPDAPRQGEALGQYVGPLLINLGTYSPEKIILIGGEVHTAAHGPLEKAGLPVIDVRVPFPSPEHELEFRQKFRQALVRADLEKMIRPLPAVKKGKDDGEVA